MILLPRKIYLPFETMNYLIDYTCVPRVYHVPCGEVGVSGEGADVWSI